MNGHIGKCKDNLMANVLSNLQPFTEIYFSDDNCQKSSQTSTSEYNDSAHDDASDCSYETMSDGLAELLGDEAVPLDEKHENRISTVTSEDEGDEPSGEVHEFDDTTDYSIDNVNIDRIKNIQIRVPYNLVGLVVGPKGATIRQIQNATHTYIISPTRERDPVFGITGLPENVELAKKEIELLVAPKTVLDVDCQDSEIYKKAIQDEDEGKEPVPESKRTDCTIDALQTLSKLTVREKANLHLVLQSLVKNKAIVTQAQGSHLINTTTMSNGGKIFAAQKFQRFPTCIRTPFITLGSQNNNGPNLIENYKLQNCFSVFPHPTSATEKLPETKNEEEPNCSLENEVDQTQSITANVFPARTKTELILHPTQSTLNPTAASWTPRVSAKTPEGSQENSGASEPDTNLVSENINRPESSHSSVDTLTPTKDFSPISETVPMRAGTHICMCVCSVCKATSRCTALVPCGHSSFCSTCAFTVADIQDSRCPICNFPVKMALNLK